MQSENYTTATTHLNYSNTYILNDVDDVNILAYSTSTKENCKTLERLHTECERWARKHGAIFAPKKYELIHLARSPKRFAMTATINIANTTLSPKQDIRVLGVQLDTRLKWHAHVEEIEKKMTKQTLALAKITTSTWGATFTKARHVYTAVVRPAMTYGSLVWHAPKELKGLSKSAENRLAVVQNKCLRLISGGYKATPVQALEAETFVPPISSHAASSEITISHAECRAGKIHR